MYRSKEKEKESISGHTDASHRWQQVSTETCLIHASVGSGAKGTRQEHGQIVGAHQDSRLRQSPP
jgi:hypothetical protein